MLTPRRRSPVLVLAWLVCLSQLAADCSGGQVRYEFGYVEIAGRPAVYAPQCDDDEVRSVRVYAAPDPDKGGDFTLLWQAEGPRNDAVRNGLIAIGDDSQFTTVQLAPPETFPRRLSISIDTARGRGPSEAREHAAELPRYGAGTPASEMTFDTQRGRRSAAQLRESLESQSAACQ